MVMVGTNKMRRPAGIFEWDIITRLLLSGIKGTTTFKGTYTFSGMPNKLE